MDEDGDGWEKRQVIGALGSWFSFSHPPPGGGAKRRRRGQIGNYDHVKEVMEIKNNIGRVKKEWGGHQIFTVKGQLKIKVM